jgi:hypothetical protein
MGWKKATGATGAYTGGGGGKSITGLDDAAQAIRQSSGAPALVYWGLRGVKTKSLVASRYSMVLKGLET